MRWDGSSMIRYPFCIFHLVKATFPFAFSSFQGSSLMLTSNTDDTYSSDFALLTISTMVYLSYWRESETLVSEVPTAAIDRITTFL